MCVCGGGGGHRGLWILNPGLTIGTDHVIIAERIFSPWVASPLWSQVDFPHYMSERERRIQFYVNKTGCSPSLSQILQVHVMQCVGSAEHVSEALNIPLCRRALRSVAHGQSKRSANVPLTLTGKPNPAQITLWYNISLVGLIVFFFPRLWWNS